MAIVKAGTGFNMNNLNVLDDNSGTPSNMTSTGFTFYNPGTGVTAQISGYGMTYDQDGWNGGTATMVTFSQNGTLLLSISNLSASGSVSYYDTGYGGEGPGLGADIAYWLSGIDVIGGMSGNETLKGYGGVDTFTGDAGNDTIDGGEGSDTVRYTGNHSNYVVTKVANGYNVSNSATGNDTLLNIEYLKFDDTTLSIDQAVNGGATQPSGTESFLLQKFGIGIGDARTWVMNHLGTPQEIYNICHDNNVTSAMLADIVQGSFTDITITGTIVNDWLHSQGQLSLD